MLVLGIETACDDTSVAIVEDGHNVRSNVIWTQKQVHARFGGVVPELAARKHAEVISLVIKESLEKAGVTFSDIGLVGVNCKHGLLRSIVVGVAAAKAIAYSRNIPLVGIHHIEGHIYSNIVKNPDIEFPHICLTVSGGHNLLIYVADHGKYELMGRTLDDAAGEAFDKVSKLLGLGFPGGPIVDQLSRNGNPRSYNFPRPMIDHESYNFSFSGLKTAVLNKVNELKQEGKELDIPNIVASFQQAVVDVLVEKLMRAVSERKVSTISLAGGVAANSLLRETLTTMATERKLRFLYPDLSLCTDNGAMVASLAYYKYTRANQTAEMDLDAMANAPLGDLNLIYKTGKTIKS